MDVFNLLAGICSIVGLFVTSFTPTKLYKKTKDEPPEKATIQKRENNKQHERGGKT